MVFNGYVYISSYNNYLYQLNATNVSQEIANFSLRFIGSSASSPIVANGYLYIGNAWGSIGYLYQLNASNISQMIANFSAAGNIDSSPSFSNNFVYVGDFNGNVYQLNASNISQEISIYTIGSNVASSFSVANGYVYFGSEDGNLYQLNANNLSLNNNFAPSETLDYPVNNSYLNNLTVNFSCSIFDDNQISSLKLLVWNSTDYPVNSSVVYLTGISNSTIFTVNLPRDDVYHFNCFGNDSSGKSSLGDNVNHTLTVDTTAPMVRINSPTNNQNLSNSTLVINFTVNDPNNNYSRIYLNGGYPIEQVNGSGIFIITLNGTNDSKMEIGLESYDLVGNMNSTSINITIDSSTPDMSKIYSPINNSVYYVNQSIYLDFDNLDIAPNKIVYFDYYHNSTSNISYTGVTPINYTINGTYNITVYANDSFGRANFSTLFFNINPVPNNSIIADLNSTLNVSENLSQIIVPYNSSLQSVNISSAILSNQNVYLDLSQLMTCSSGICFISDDNSLQQAITINHDGPNNLSLYIPIGSNTLVSNRSWDGKLSLPIVNSSTFTAPSSGTTNLVISLGSSQELNFTSPVKITIGGMAGKKAAFARGTTTLTPITTYCNSITNPTNIDPITTRECYHNSTNATDLIIWSYHLTDFAAYTPAVVVTNTTDNSTEDSSSSAVSKIVNYSSYWKNTYNPNLGQIAQGYSKNVSAQERIKIQRVSKFYYLGFIEITSSSISINLSTNPEQDAIMLVGETKKFDLDNDNYYDILLNLTDIQNNKANVILKNISEKIVAISPAAATETNTNNNPGFGAVSPPTLGQTEKPIKSGNIMSNIGNFIGDNLLLIIILLFVALIIVVIILILRSLSKVKYAQPNNALDKSKNNNPNKDKKLDNEKSDKSSVVSQDLNIKNNKKDDGK